MRRASLPIVWSLLLPLAATACGSAAPSRSSPSPGEVPPPIGADAEAESPAATPDPASTTRPLAWVNGEVVTYRDVLREIGPQLQVLQDKDKARTLERSALLRIVRERVVFQAAERAQVPVRDSEVEQELSSALTELEQSGGTLDAFLRERGMTRREYEEFIKRDIASRKYMYAAVGRSSDRNVLVRPRADTYVAPEDVRKYYDRHPEQFEEPATARFRRLTLRFDRGADDPAAAKETVRKTLEDVRSRLQSGEDWVPIYRELTADDTDRDPLDGLVTVQAGDDKYTKEIADFAFGSPKGTVSDIKALRTSFYLLYAEGATPARVVPYEEVQNKVRSHLTSLKRAAAAYEVELDLLQDATVEPEGVREELRLTLREARRKLVQEAGF